MSAQPEQNGGPFKESNRELKPDRVNFRMADWAQLLLKTNPKKKADYIQELLAKINRDQILFLIESNPLSRALSIWLKDKR